MKTWEEKAIEKENANSIQYGCPVCGETKWRLDSLKGLWWECLTCQVHTIFSETYLNAYWAGYHKALQEIKEE